MKSILRYLYPKEKKSHENSKMQITDRADIISIIVFFVAVFQLFLTLVFPVGPSSDPFEVYLRNFTSIISTGLLAEFFNKYNQIRYLKKSHAYMKTIKVISVLLTVACVVKVVISIVFGVKYIVKGNLVALYYFGETLAWTAVAFFAVAYYRRTVNKAPKRVPAVKSEKQENKSVPASK